MGSPNRLRPYWKCKVNRKKVRGSQAAGKTKTGCIVSSLDKYMAKYSRSYKHQSYSEWYQKVLEKNSMSSPRKSKYGR